MGNEKESERVSTLLTPTDKAKLKEMAYSKGHKVAPMLRKLVRDALTEWEQPQVQGGRNETKGG